MASKVTDIDGLKIDLSAIDNVESLKGDPGFSPTVTFTAISNGTKVTITDVDHPTEGQSFDVMNGVIDVESMKAALTDKLTIDTVEEEGVNYMVLKYDGTELSRTECASTEIHCTSVSFSITTKEVSGNLPMLVDGIVQATILPSDCTQDYAYISGNTSVATVDTYGQVTAVSRGKTNIICSCGNRYAFYELTVHDFNVCESVSIDDKVFLFDYDQQKTFQLSSTPTPSEYTGSTVWSLESLVPNASTGEYINAATINQNGLITYTKPCKVRATVTCGEAKASKVIECFQKLSMCEHSFDTGYISEDGYKLRAATNKVTPTHPEEGCLFRLHIGDTYEFHCSDTTNMMFNMVPLLGNVKTSYPMYAYACPSATMFTVAKSLASIVWSTKDTTSSGIGTITLGENKIATVTYGDHSFTSSVASYPEYVFVSFNMAFRNQQATYNDLNLATIASDGTLWNEFKIVRNGEKILGGME